MEQINLLFVLGGLLFLTLFSASLFKSYQERMAEKRRRIQRLLRGVDMVERVMFRLDGFPLQAEVERLMWEDVLNRYRKVKEIHARYQGLDGSIARVEALLNQPRPHGEVLIHDAPKLRRIIVSLNEVIGIIKQGMLLTRLQSKRITELVELVATRRAEAVYRYHKHKAEELNAQGDTKQAVKHCLNIRSYLFENGPTNDQVKQWYEEADAMKKGYEAANHS